MTSAQKSTNPLVGSGVGLVALPKAREGEEQYQFVAVNGVSYRIKKGSAVEVPASVAEVIRNADLAENANDAFLEANWDKNQGK